MSLCMFPAGVPPDGAKPNFDDPDETLVPVLITVVVILAFLAIITTVCRLFANRRKLWWSDYFVAVALILALAHGGLMLAQTKFARHQWDIRACWYDGTYTKKPMRIAVICGIIFSGLLYFTNIPVSAYLSAPHVGETWTSVLFSGRPQKNLIWGVVQSALSIVLDLYIFILPIPTIMRLQLSPKRKFQILTVFVTALLGVIAGALSLVYRVQAIGTNDGTWKYTALVICTVVENDVSIIVCNTPGFANFTRTYIADLGFIKSLHSTFTGGSSTWKLQGSTPNNTDTRGATKGFSYDRGDELELLEDNVPRTTSSITVTKRTEVVREIRQQPNALHRPRPGEPDVSDFPMGEFYYGPSAQPPLQGVWFYYIPANQ
ncbi:unnamed protein product [Clonostachys rosea]|uniref:Rhodopsin domain-containing protein n=1 Tax=Bionectria ochroleuca TaxID=29856 RepID=A0ABY6UWU4_BIOOC|nr:unnamed protein product [Clonostachys rosea]